MNHKNSDIIMINQKLITMTKSNQINSRFNKAPNEYQNFTINLFINQHNIRKNNASGSPGSRTEAQTENKDFHIY